VTNTCEFSLCPTDGIKIIDDLMPFQSPHCQILQKQKQKIESLCKKRKVDYKFVRSDKDWTADDYLKVSNQGSASFSHLAQSGLVDKILGGTLLDDLLVELAKTGRSDRGSVQRYAGYATMNQKFDDLHSITAPQMINSMDAIYVKRMVDFTSLIKLFCSEFDLPCPYSDDPDRTKDWSQRCCDEYKVEGVNLIEQVTFALTCLDDDTSKHPIIFGSHVDHLNDPQWPEVFCIYKHFLKDKKLYRLAAIAYSRSINRLFRFKDKAYTCLKGKIISYLKSPNNADRIDLSIDGCLPLAAEEYTDDGNIRYRKTVPFLDKAGFYSGFADAILKVWDGTDVERLCEVLILVGWIPTATTFQKILTEWSQRTHLPPGVWTFAYMSDAVRAYGGITKGAGHRCQPWMNQPMLQGSIIDGLYTLRRAIMDTQTQGGKADYPYARLHKTLQEIGGVGPLGAQHIIGVASLLNAIHPRYQSIATIAGTTKTAKKVKRLYNLSAVVLEKQKTEVSLELDVEEKVVENGYCEMIKEDQPTAPGDVPSQTFNEEAHAVEMLKRRAKPIWPDVYFHGQVLRTVRDGRLVELYRGMQSEELMKVIPYNHLQESLEEPVWKKMVATEGMRRIVIETSLKHLNPDPVGKKIKKRVKARSVITHSGFGVHNGLEKLLNERE
jgi:hypothetical protein